MDGKVLNLKHTVRVDIEEWKKSFESFVSFTSMEDAALFWALRRDIVPAFSEEICLLSQNPHNQKWFLIGHLIQDDDKKFQELFWKNAWYEGRQKFGKEVWNAYYKGVRDQQTDSVYLKDYGQKFYPEIK